MDSRVVDRTKLGVESHNQTDELSGLFQSETDIENLKSGQVALLKGERWMGNEGAGLVHRSPRLDEGEQRFLLSLDFVRNSGLTIELRQRTNTRLRDYLTNIVDICGNNMRIINPSVMTPTKGKAP